MIIIWSCIKKRIDSYLSNYYIKRVYSHSSQKTVLLYYVESPPIMRFSHHLFFICLEGGMSEYILPLQSDRSYLLLGDIGISSIGSFIISGTSRSSPRNSPDIRTTINKTNKAIIWQTKYLLHVLWSVWNSWTIATQWLRICLFSDMKSVTKIKSSQSPR